MGSYFSLTVYSHLSKYFKLWLFCESAGVTQCLSRTLSQEIFCSNNHLQLKVCSRSFCTQRSLSCLPTHGQYKTNAYPYLTGLCVSCWDNRLCAWNMRSKSKAAASWFVVIWFHFKNLRFATGEANAFGCMHVMFVLHPIYILKSFNLFTAFPSYWGETSLF